MTKRPRLTDKDWQTIRIALNYAMEERDGLADAYSRTGPEAEAALALVAKFERLHEKMFNSPSHRQASIDRFASAPTVSIHELHGKGGR